MNFLITGGSGFIGSAVIRELICNTEHNVINVDKLTYAGNEESLRSIEKSSRYIFEKVDICDAKEIKRILNSFNPDIVMHLAAESHVDRSITKPKNFIQTNIVGTYILLEEVRLYWESLSKNKKKSFRFHHISTDEVYGDLPHPDYTNGIVPLFTEKTPYAPSSPYSASKASSDHLVRAWYRTYGLPILITNCSNNYGPFQYPEKLIPLTILNLINSKEIPIYGKGNQIRDWLNVDDHARALITVALIGKVGETYNIGGNNEKRNIEVVDKICEIMEEFLPVDTSKLDIESYKELKVYVTDRPGHDLRYAIDATKISNELGWAPQETFDSGIRKTVKWYIENLTWCNQIQKNNI